MQLFGLVNTMLAHDRITAERDLSIARYAVIPLSPNSGALPNLKRPAAAVHSPDRCQVLMLLLQLPVLLHPHSHTARELPSVSVRRSICCHVAVC